MFETLRCITPFAMFLALPYILLQLLRSRIPRRSFALSASLLLGAIHFIIVIMFVKENPLAIGVIVLVPLLVSAYVCFYLIYPRLLKVAGGSLDQQ